MTSHILFAVLIALTLLSAYLGGVLGTVVLFNKTMGSRQALAGKIALAAMAIGSVAALWTHIFDTIPVPVRDQYNPFVVSLCFSASVSAAIWLYDRATGIVGRLQGRFR